MLISVIICTCNRGERLLDTLKSIENMSVDTGVEWELIIVDNNSTDNTKSVIQEFSCESRIPMRYVFESAQGLSNARNAGLREATGGYTAFTDDDCIIDKQWLTSIIREFESDPDLIGIGGRVELYNDKDQRVTVRTYKERLLFASPYDTFKLFTGCNMAFARRVYDLIGTFDPEFGAGTKLKSAEDSDFFYRVFKAGGKMIYSPEVLVYHNHGRNTDSQVRALNRGYVIGRGAFYCKHIMKGDSTVLKMAFREYLSRIKNIIKKLSSGTPIMIEVKYAYYLIVGVVYRIGLMLKNS
ncbi:MAG: glycosyltransferase family A protein [Nitrospirota bacterium]